MAASEMTSSPVEPLRRFEGTARIAVALLLALGCWLVLQPFFSAILFAMVIAASTWPAYRPLRSRLWRRPALAAVIGCLMVMALILGPAALLAASVGDAVPWLLKLFDEWTHGGMPQPPDWLPAVPLFGDWLQTHWIKLASGQAQAPDLAGNFADLARRLLLNFGSAAANGLLQATLTVLVLYFFYRNGERLGSRLGILAARLGGSLAPQLLATAQHTVSSVMIGILGTALAQAMVAILGFTFAGVPNPLLLGAATFVLSLVPVGPPLIWGGAALWLFRDGAQGWALFMAVYGLLCISTVDNIIKPYLISRGTHLPFVVTLLGVLGGLFAFGLIGVFLGPILLGLAINLTVHWLALVIPDSELEQI